MNGEPDLQVETEIAHRYFSSFADDYQSAIEGHKSRSLLHGIVNRFFRRCTFQERSRVVRGILERSNLAGKTVLDLGCGPGEISVIAAQLGAKVVGLDIVDEMIVYANARAKAAGVDKATSFRTADLLTTPLDNADLSLLVGVVEYYGDLDGLLSRTCDATRETVIIADTRGPFWRRQLRYLLARMKRFRLYYHPPQRVVATMEANGFAEREHIDGHSFRVMVFDRRKDLGSHG